MIFIVLLLNCIKEGFRYPTIIFGGNPTATYAHMCILLVLFLSNWFKVWLILKYIFHNPMYIWNTVLPR